MPKTNEGNITNDMEIADDKNSRYEISQEQIEHLKSIIKDKEEQILSLQEALTKSQDFIVNVHQSIPLKLFRNYDASIGKIMPLRLKKKIELSKKRLAIKNSQQVMETLQTQKTNKIDIICFPLVNWNYRYQRPQHILSGLARKGHRIFYLTTTLQNLPNSYAIEKLDENIYEVSLSCTDYFDIYKDKIDKLILQSLVNSFKQLQKDVNINALSLVMFPSWLPLVSELQKLFGYKILFDCVDNVSGFPNIHKARIKEEEVLVKCSDLVVVSSDTLFVKIKEHANKIICIPNAGDFSHFSKSTSEHLLRDFPKPVVGYFGAIAEWFDTNLIEFIAKKRNDITFVFIGDTYGSNLKKLMNLDNVYFLGERPYSEIPKYLIEFDVCLIPFKMTKLIQDTHPIKIYEYFAAGKPVVTTDIPALHKMNDLCYIAKNSNDFLAKLDLALNEKNPDLVNRRIEFSSKNTWQERINLLYPELEKVLSLCPDKE